MTSPDPLHEEAPVPRKLTAAERQAQAEETLRKIVAGGDVGQEAQNLSNDFTDEYTGRLRAWARLRFGRRSS